MTDVRPYCDLRDEVFAVEAEMLRQPQLPIDLAEIDVDTIYQVKLPVTYYHGGGVFTGELFIPKGTLIVGKIHKFENVNVLSKGELSVLVDNEIKRLKAPSVVVAKAGSKRIFYAHEDSIWMTFHATKEVDPNEVEKIFIAQTEQEYLEFCKSEPLLPFFIT